MRKVLLFCVLMASLPTTFMAQLKFTYVSPATNTIKIKNFGASAVNISTYRLCALFEYTSLVQPGVALVTGDFNLSQNEEVTFTWNSTSGFNPSSSDLGLYLPTGAFNSAANMVDFMQYGGSGQGREGVAASAGYWMAGTFHTGTGPWYYIGNGSASGIAQWSTQAPFNVTFSVDMSQQIVNVNGVHIAGSFQGWNAGSTLMTDIDLDGIYEYTAIVQGNNTIQYKFINGNTFGGQETVPAVCGVDDGFGAYNRSLSIVSSDLDLAPVCFGECTSCAIVVDPLTVDVTFQVNMQDEVVSANGVHIAGSFQSWNAGTSLMTDLDTDGIYEFTAAIDTNSIVEYVFINGNTFGSQEIVPGACGVDNGFGGFNRSFDVLESDVTIDPVCFGACVDCVPIIEPLTVDVTFKVNMQNETVSPNGVHVVGSFQGYDPAASEMTDIDLDGIYEFTAAIDTNSTIQYAFINGDTFGGQELVPGACGVDNGFGGFNRNFEVLEADAVLDAVCFSECADCVPIIEPLTVDVTFKVNMQNETVSPNGVHVVGSFQGFDPAASEMTDMDLDGIYEFTAAIDTNSTIQYAFINGDTFGGQELVPGACGVDNGFGGFNRNFEVLEADVVLEAVCFGECADCVPIIEPLTVDVTFLVDMNDAIISPDGVHIAGSFQNWNPAASQMVDSNLDGVYEFTAAIDTNSTIQYVYINGITFLDKEIVPAECGVDDGFGQFNRELEVLESDITTSEICFGSCTSCVIVDPLTVMVTFSVNMQGTSINPLGVNIVGDFTGNVNSIHAMSDINGDQIYEVTLEVEANATILYVFVNGETMLEEESVPSECSMLSEINEVRRFIETTDVDATLEPVCFSSCVNCIEPSNMITLMVNMMNETVSPNGVHVAGNFQNWNPATSEMTDDDSDGVYEITFETDEWANLSFKFINGDTWTDAEIVPSTCGLPDGNGGYNRILETGGVDVNFGPVCFNECANCEGAVQFVDVMFSVNMTNEVVDANGVHIAGSFQGWNASASEMTDIDADGIYEFTAQVESNTIIQFRFLNGNDWPFSETVPVTCGVDDGFGGLNRSLSINNTDVVFGPVCFGACVNCDVIVEPTTIDVTFSVNMQNEAVDANGVHIAGSFQNWQPGTSEMTDNDVDGIYEITLPVPINSNGQFRFINGNDWPFSEAVPTGCGVDDGFGGLNRSIDVLENDTTYGPVCFGACEDCLPSVPVLVIFQVDMSNETVSADGVFIGGTFNNWDETATQLSEYEPGHYQAVVVVNAGEVVQYKFINGMDWAGSEVVPAECGVGIAILNREYETTASDMQTLDLVCFSSCSSCVIVEMVDLTITVDMNEETVTNGVYLAGSFNEFSANATPMINTTGALYSATISVPANTTTTYKFLNGPDFAGVELVPFACGVDDGFGGFNRSFTCDAIDVTLPTVCFSSCVACPISVDELSQYSLHIYPNPADEFFTISNADGSAEYVLVYDVTGNLVLRQRIISESNTIVNTEEWSSGLYQVVIPGKGKATIVVR